MFRLLRFPLALALLFCASPVWAQSPAPAVPSSSPATLRVVTREVAPFVVRHNGQLSGFSIELWAAIGKQLGVRTQWDVQPDIKSLLNEVRSGRAQAGISAISITSKREQIVDFSQPMFDSGLQILTKGQAAQPAQPSLLNGLEQLIKSPLMLQFLGAVIVLTIIPANVLWVLERRHPEGIIRAKSYFPGIFEAVWWTVTCLATQAEEMPKAVLSRIMAVGWMFFAILFTAYVTGTLTASLTVQSLRGTVQGPGDLPGKRVATVAGSTSQDYLTDNQAIVSAFPTPERAFAALEAGDVEAVVYDAPILAFYANNEGKARTQLVGPVFRPESYGIALRNNSLLRKRVNLALLQLRESGAYDALRIRYFGDPAASSSS